jgi:DNA (cytosine-5)-methyltransferase 1
MNSRILVENATGLPGPKDLKIGKGHGFIDCTDTPAPTVVASRPVSVMVAPLARSAPAPRQDKPDYHVPSMLEIAALKPNGYTAASTFSGCGGSSLGYRMAGFRLLYANEFIEAARTVYRANASPATIIDGRDVREVTAASILEQIGLAPGELDLLDGSPPCAAFSTAGKRAKKWGQESDYSDTVQRSDDLFFEFARLVDGIRPKVFVAENVSGLIKGVAKGYFLEILAALKAAGGGYRVEARLLDAQWLGVPQARQRVIFIGVRSDLGVAPAFPKPLPYRYSIRDALPWITTVRGGQGAAFEAKGRPYDLAQPSATILGTKPQQMVVTGPPIEPETDISKFAIGKAWAELAPGQMGQRRYINLYRPSFEKACPTVTASGGVGSAAGVTHPSECRKFSIAELKRICGFPDDFALSGSYAQQWERLGRAVPPVMMAQIASTVRDQVLARIAR